MRCAISRRSASLRTLKLSSAATKRRSRSCVAANAPASAFSEATHSPATRRCSASRCASRRRHSPSSAVMRSDSLARIDAVHFASCACFQTSSSHATAYSRPWRRPSMDATLSAAPAAMVSRCCARCSYGAHSVSAVAVGEPFATDVARSMDARSVLALTTALGTLFWEVRLCDRLRPERASREALIECDRSTPMASPAVKPS
mmetsp:Transcript_12347/g.46030  ORF Transcript_12347/g.46030 Transcript_12347/m.46030 type:complete len:203 (-) Transcript_12347:1271-1879(-)